MTVVINMETLEADKKAIARLYVRGYINEATKKKAYAKLAKEQKKLETQK